jgi:hypothetical protein
LLIVLALGFETFFFTLLVLGIFNFEFDGVYSANSRCQVS